MSEEMLHGPSSMGVGIAYHVSLRYHIAGHMQTQEEM